jgi:hypothetical protein
VFADCKGGGRCLLKGKAGDATCIIGFQCGMGGCLLKGKAGVGAKCVRFLKVEVVIFGKSLPLLVLINFAAAVTISLHRGALTFDAFYFVNFCSYCWGNDVGFDCLG